MASARRAPYIPHRTRCARQPGSLLRLAPAHRRRRGVSPVLRLAIAIHLAVASRSPPGVMSPREIPTWCRRMALGTHHAATLATACHLSSFTSRVPSPHPALVSRSTTQSSPGEGAPQSLAAVGTCPAPISPRPRRRGRTPRARGERGVTAVRAPARRLLSAPPCTSSQGAAPVPSHPSPPEWTSSPHPPCRPSRRRSS